MDEDEEFNPKFNFSTDIRFNFRLSQTPLFAYDYLNTDILDYSFHHRDFEKFEYELYFSQVKKFSKIPLGKLLDNFKRTDHFQISFSHNAIEKDLLEKTFGISSLSHEQCPPMGHFHLHTPKEYVAGNKALFFIYCFTILIIQFTQ